MQSLLASEENCDSSSSAAAATDEPVTSSSADIHASSQNSAVRSPNTRHIQRQQLACQHEVDIGLCSVLVRYLAGEGGAYVHCTVIVNNNRITVSFSLCLSTVF